MFTIVSRFKQVEKKRCIVAEKSEIKGGYAKEYTQHNDIYNKLKICN